LRVHFHAHGGQRTSTHLHLADTLNLGQLLREDGRSDIVHLRRGDHVRLHGEDDDGLIGRVYLAVTRIGRKVRGQEGFGGLDGGGHIAGGSINVAAEIKLQNHAGRTE